MSARARCIVTICGMLLFTAGAWGQAASKPASQPAIPPSAVGRVTPVVLAYRKARPAVVSIQAQTVVTAGVFGNDPFEDIFPSPLRREVPVQSLGSGVIVNPGGYVITNAHVIRKAEKITVELMDKSSYAARVIMADTGKDLAVLKIDPPKGVAFPFLPLGRSDDLMVGETVIAIGNAMGYANSLTTGVVSALDRELDFGGGVKYGGLVQTDAPINPGNSGGPLLNINGELIGFNTAIRADAQNIGFAIPADVVAQELPGMLDSERLSRLIVGFTAQPRHGDGGDEVLVSSVRKGSPADGRLVKGDRVLAIDDAPVRQITDYAFAMLGIEADEKLRVKLVRDGKEMTAEVTVLAKPRPDGKLLAQKLWGMTLKPVTADVARDMGLSVDRGLVVIGLEDGSPAQKLGIQLKDVLFQVGGYFVTDMDGLGILLEEMPGGETSRIGIVRRNVRAWAPITARQVQSTTATATSATSRPAE